MRYMKDSPVYLLILLLTLGGAGLVACAETAEAPAPGSAPAHAAPPREAPSISGVDANLAMEDGEVTRDVTVSLNLPGFGFTNVRWAGNIIFYRDVKPPLTPGEPATTAEGTYRETFDNVVSWEDLSPGRHTFWAQLVTPDLEPLDPHVDARVEMDVPSPRTDEPFMRSLGIQMLCRPGYTPPDMPGRPEGDEACADINVITDVQNFRIVNKIGEQNAVGEGHLIYYFNVAPPTAPGQPALTEEGTYAVTVDSIASWVGVAPGEYELWVQLVNNDNTPLEPPVTAGGAVIVPVDAARYWR